MVFIARRSSKPRGWMAISPLDVPPWSFSNYKPFAVRILVKSGPRLYYSSVRLSIQVGWVVGGGGIATLFFPSVGDHRVKADDDLCSLLMTYDRGRDVVPHGGHVMVSSTGTLMRNYFHPCFSLSSALYMRRKITSKYAPSRFVSHILRKS